jgi:7,8-dihydropterin-6-yl-methyl-4-(beta-D-ribofuranosyl)aminobenzene 5'-phosphate synthase
VNQKVRIVVLVENTACGEGLLGEHGLGYWIESGARRAIFDTGQGMSLEHNAGALNIPLVSTDAIVLSHGHYDHAGGLSRVIGAAPQATLFAHSGAFSRKYVRSHDGSARYLGIPTLDEADIQEEAIPLIWTTDTTEILDGMFVTGEIPRMTDFEDTGGPFFLDEKLNEPDPLLDDQAAFLDTSVGTVVILGCAHSGVINTLRYVQTLTNYRPIHTVIGGMHLLDASPDRMDKTVSELRSFDLQRLMLGHCTGRAAMERFGNEFPGRCATCHVGTVLEFER